MPFKAMSRVLGMEIYLRVIDAGSLAKVAQELGCDEDAIEDAIAWLADDLDVRLLSRRDGRTGPTYAGLQRAMEYRTASLENTHAAPPLVARDANAPLRISCVMTLSAADIMPSIYRACRARPSLPVEVIRHQAPGPAGEPASDLEIWQEPPPSDRGFTSRIASTKRSVLTTSTYVDRVGAPESPADLQLHPAIMQVGQPSIWSLRRGSAEASVRMRCSLRFGDAETQRAAVLAGFGVTIGLHHGWGQEASGIRMLLQDWSPTPLDIWSCIPVSTNHAALVLKVVELLRQTLFSIQAL